MSDITSRTSPESSDRDPEPGHQTHSADDDGLLSFNSENPSETVDWSSQTTFQPLSPTPSSGAHGPIRFVSVVLLALVVIAVGYLVVSRAPTQPLDAAVVPEGQATLDSNPAGAEVLVEGVIQGVTPLQLSLPAGTHEIEVRAEGVSRTISLPVEAGRLTAQYVELASPRVVDGPGRLEVTSVPAGAAVIVDGTSRGLTPLTIETIGPGVHEITVASQSGTVTRSVSVEPGATATVMASLAVANPAGWVALEVPFEMQVFENGQLLSTTGVERLVLPAGSHTLELFSAEYQFRTTLTLDIVSGDTVREVVALPNGSLSINALPWAEVWIDGVSAGTTPLANLSMPIGRHDVVFRHPEYAERRDTVLVTEGAPTRLGVDLR